jgi:hypothetical protein
VDSGERRKAATNELLGNAKEVLMWCRRVVEDGALNLPVTLAITKVRVTGGNVSFRAILE